MKRNITITLVSQTLSIVMDTGIEMIGEAFVGRCRSIWNRRFQDHPESLGYSLFYRSGRHQFSNCLAPN